VSLPRCRLQVVRLALSEGCLPSQVLGRSCSFRLSAAPLGWTLLRSGPPPRNCRRPAPTFTWRCPSCRCPYHRTGSSRSCGPHRNPCSYGSGRLDKGRCNHLRVDSKRGNTAWRAGRFHPRLSRRTCLHQRPSLSASASDCACHRLTCPTARPPVGAAAPTTNQQRRGQQNNSLTARLCHQPACATIPARAAGPHVSPTSGSEHHLRNHTRKLE